ncbi:MAG: CPBP family intramembrane glutamic endopeptidase [Nocardioides sp.]
MPTPTWSRLPFAAWTLRRCVIGVVVAVLLIMLSIPSTVTSYLGEPLLSILGVSYDDDLYGPCMGVLEKSISLLFALGVLVWVLRPISSRVLGIALQPWQRVLGIGVAGAVLLNVIVEVWTRATGNSGVDAGQLRQLGFGSASLNDLLLVIAIAIVGPVFEEFLFRGLLYRSLRESLRRFGPPLAVGVAGLVSALFFAGIHGDPTQVALFPMYIVYGLVSVAVYELTGSLVAPVVMHAASNAWALAAPGLNGPVSTPAMILVVLAPVIAVLLTLLSARMLDLVGGDR